MTAGLLQVIHPEQGGGPAQRDSGGYGGRSHGRVIHESRGDSTSSSRPRPPIRPCRCPLIWPVGVEAAEDVRLLLIHGVVEGRPTSPLRSPLPHQRAAITRSRVIPAERSESRVVMFPPHWQCPTPGCMSHVKTVFAKKDKCPICRASLFHQDKGI